MSYDLSRSQAAYEAHDEFDFICVLRECSAGSNDEADMKRCEGCGGRFCSEHIRKIGDESYCDACGVCVSCKAPATQDGPCGLTCTIAVVIAGDVYCCGRLAAGCGE